MGLKDEVGSDTVKIFCPKCQCVYHPPTIRSKSHSLDDIGSASVDGAAFGTTFPHLFLMTFHNLVPDRPPPESAYVPRVFGFKLHKSAKSRNDVVVNHNNNNNNNNNNNTPPAAVAIRSSKRSQASVATTAAAAVPETHDNTAELDAANCKGESTAIAPLEEDVVQEDNTVTSPAATAVVSVEIPTVNDNSNPTKGNKGQQGSSSITTTKNKKVGKGKSEDSGGSSKRKGKNASNGNCDTDGKVKRQKRSSNKT